MDICTRTLLPSADTLLGIAAGGLLVSSAVGLTDGPAPQVAVSLLFYHIHWAITLAITAVVFLPFGTCNYAIAVDYTGYQVPVSIYNSYTNVAILLLLSASLLSASLGAWHHVAPLLGDADYWSSRPRGKRMATVFLWAVQSAEACKRGMEGDSFPPGIWSKAFWLLPRIVHNYLTLFRRLGSWSVQRQLGTEAKPQGDPADDHTETSPLLNGAPERRAIQYDTATRPAGAPSTAVSGSVNAEI